MRSNSPLHKTEPSAMAYEHSFDAHVRDVYKPALARLAGLEVWLGFDLLSDRAGDGARFGSVGLRQHCRLLCLNPPPAPLYPRDDLDSVPRRLWTPEGLSRTSRLQGRSPHQRKTAKAERPDVCCQGVCAQISTRAALKRRPEQFGACMVGGAAPRRRLTSSDSRVGYRSSDYPSGAVPVLQRA
jgi:hypothetical protein